MRVFAVSDIHTNYPDNRRWVESISSTDFKNDIILVAGDVSHSLKDIEYTLSLFKSKFKDVFFVPGNHDLWVSREDIAVAQDSIAKFELLQQMCDKLGVRMQPKEYPECKLVIFPLLGWYEESFDDLPNAKDHIVEGWMDFRFCKWPSTISDPLTYFLKLNEQRIESVLNILNSRSEDKNPYVITFSHFLPRIQLLPPRDVLLYKFLPKVMGSKKLDAQLRQLKSKVHVFGHSHINWNQIIDGVHYVQRALRYPSERQMWVTTTDLNEMMVWDEKSSEDNLYKLLKQQSDNLRSKQETH